MDGGIAAKGSVGVVKLEGGALSKGSASAGAADGAKRSPMAFAFGSGADLITLRS